MSKKKSNSGEVISLPIIHSVESMPCSVINCDNLAYVAIGTGWAADTGDAMQLTAICQQHANQLAAAYRDG